ncbi:MAG: DUF5678 domain-containing protein [Chthoniobacteraceae bacterium]|nr:DUF5678 domain-containing protein [Chthoniobacteraceae bacterium]
MSNPLESEFEYYLANQQSLVRRFKGRYIVIKDQKVIGDYANPIEAIETTQKSHKLGTFLVQEVEPGKDNYTQVFHTRVAFA